MGSSPISSTLRSAFARSDRSATTAMRVVLSVMHLLLVLFACAYSLRPCASDGRRKSRRRLRKENAVSEDRTHDLRIMRPTRCQLRYHRSVSAQIVVCVARTKRRAQIHASGVSVRGCVCFVRRPAFWRCRSCWPFPDTWNVVVTCPHRLVVRTSRCGRDNPGSTPGEDTLHSPCWPFPGLWKIVATCPRRGRPVVAATTAVWLCTCVCSIYFVQRLFSQHRGFLITDSLPELSKGVDASCVRVAGATANNERNAWTVSSDTLAEWLRRRPAKPMGSPRVGSNPTGVVFTLHLQSVCCLRKDWSLLESPTPSPFPQPRACCLLSEMADGSGLKSRASPARSDSCGVRTHALADWRLKPAP